MRHGALDVFERVAVRVGLRYLLVWTGGLSSLRYGA